MLISISLMLRCVLKKWPRSWAQSGLCWAQSDQAVRDAACSSSPQVASRSYFLSFGMELSCKSCLAELFLSLCMELLFKTCSAKLFFELLRGTAVQKLPCEAIAYAFAWKCCAKAALQNYFLRFCMEPSYKSCLAKLFHNILHAAVVQKPPCKTMP